MEDGLRPFSTTEAQREAAPASEALAVIHLGAAVDELDNAAEKVTGIGSRMLSAIAERFASFIIALADFIAPAPPPTKDQAERMQRAADERQEQNAAAAHDQEKSERLRATLEQIARDDASLAQRYGRPITREANQGRDRDDDYGREREGER